MPFTSTSNPRSRLQQYVEESYIAWERKMKEEEDAAKVVYPDCVEESYIAWERKMKEEEDEVFNRR